MDRVCKRVDRMRASFKYVRINKYPAFPFNSSIYTFFHKVVFNVFRISVLLYLIYFIHEKKKQKKKKKKTFIFI